MATPSDKLEEEQDVKVKVLDVDPEEQRLSLSIKALEEAPARQEESNDGFRKETKKRSPKAGQKKARPQNRQNNNTSDDDSGFTMSDILGDQLKGFSFDDE